MYNVYMDVYCNSSKEVVVELDGLFLYSYFTELSDTISDFDQCGWPRDSAVGEYLFSFTDGEDLETQYPELFI